jgi:hypothetical protein
VSRPSDKLIAALNLSPHPEGGWYREVWRAAERVTVQRDGEPSERAAATGIDYLLAHGERSRFHRIDADELWLWQGGGTMDVYVLTKKSGLHTLRVGPPGAPGTHRPALVPAGTWFAAAPAADADWSLASCIVSPGFEYAAFELAERATLTALWPEHAALIARFTRPTEDHRP